MENFTITMEDHFLDVAVTRRVAVLDFGDSTGGIRRGARLQPPEKNRKIGRYNVTKGRAIISTWESA